jgi:DNA repair exonuclease SbcCD ATPase subunit
VRLFCGEEECSAKNVKETQKTIDMLLGRDFKTWSQTDFFGQGRKLAFADLTPAQRYQILEEILPIEELQTWISYTRENKKKIEEQYNRWKNQAMYLTLAAKEAASDFVVAEESYLGWDHKQRKKIAVLQDNLTTHDREVEEIDTQIEALTKSLSGMAPDSLDVLTQRKTEIETEIREALKKKDSADRICSDWRAHRAGHAAKVQEINTSCNVCGNPLTDQQVTELMDQQVKLNKDISEADFALQKGTEAVNYWGAMVGGLRENAARWNDEYRKCCAARDEDEITRRELVKYEAKKDSRYREQICRQLLQAHEENNPHLTAYERSRSACAHKDLLLSEAKKKLDEIDKQLNHLRFWERAFSVEIRNYLLAQVCDFLNAKANEFISKLGNSQITIDFSTDKLQASGEVKNEFNVKVTSATGGGDYALLSGGEQALTSFAIGLALASLAESQTVGSCGFMVLDEPFTNLGPTNCERLVQFLRTELETKKETILLISNESPLRDLISNHIEVVKHEGTTSLVE